ncbi:MAG: WYL domain-containing protein [Actinomycetia bacterium]|nr:WYL domain-containing protein [Actinomycetes bacterium]
MTGAHDQVGRLLALTPYLRTHPWVEVDEAARVFGVSPHQLIEDLRVLQFCGLPGGLPDDLIDIDLDAAYEEGVISVRNADFLDRPARLRADEAMGLLVALQAVGELADGPAADATASVLAKLTALLGAGTTPVRVELASGSQAVRDALASAVREGRRVRLTYDGLARGETSTPVVDPGPVVVRDGVAYLQAFSVERGAWRTYRLDRIAQVEPLETPAGEVGAAPQAAGGWFDDVSVDNEVTLRVDAGAAWVGEYYPTRRSTVLDDGTFEFVLPVADPRWLTGLLLQLGPAVRAVEPPEAAAEAVAQARAALAWYDTPAD